ncbi:flagellar filament capping protein FliD [Thiobacter aerophilum]|uniref:Flagellar hook-associated protein 2 n=1 Tax=Thiobacter aerophilum TaxID=3121275 RepID=A0ABV0ED88_9BURK
MAISSAGIGSNLDVNGLVSQLMAIERRPLNVLDQKKSLLTSEISAYGKLKSDLAALQSAIGALKDRTDFQVFKAIPATDVYFTATADATALPGTHSITVTQLAQAQKLVSGAFADTNTTQVGLGTLTLSNGTNSFTVTIDSSNNTLAGIANAINSATGNFGVSATLLNDGTGYRLVLSPNDTGAAKAITVAVTDTGDGNNTDNLGLSRLSYVAGGQNLTQTVAAQDAVLTVDGLTGITSASNSVSGVIQGVTLNLKAVGSTQLTVAVDRDAITAKVNDFINAYNKLVSDMDELHQKGGTLEAQNTVLTIQSQILGVFNASVNLPGNDFNYLAQIGISLQKDGKLALNSADFNAAVSNKLDSVINLLTDNTQGFAQRLFTQLDNLLQTNGVLDATTQSLNASISDIEQRKAQLQVRLDAMEQRLRAQFAALDAMLGSMQQTSSQLLRALSSLPR